jgi:hypothetical protein
MLEFLFWLGTAVGLAAGVYGLWQIRKEDRCSSLEMAVYEQKWREANVNARTVYHWQWPEQTWLRRRMNELRKKDFERIPHAA